MLPFSPIAGNILEISWAVSACRSWRRFRTCNSAHVPLYSLFHYNSWWERGGGVPVKRLRDFSIHILATSQEVEVEWLSEDWLLFGRYPSIWEQLTRDGIFKLLRSPGLFQGLDSASLCSLAGRYNNPTATRFLAPIDSSKNSSTENRARTYSFSVPSPHRLFKNSSSELDKKVLRCNRTSGILPKADTQNSNLTKYRIWLISAKSSLFKKQKLLYYLFFMWCLFAFKLENKLKKNKGITQPLWVLLDHKNVIELFSVFRLICLHLNDAILLYQIYWQLSNSLLKLLMSDPRHRQESQDVDD